MHPIFPTIPSEVKTGNSCEKFLNEIHQIIFSLHREKITTKKVYKT